LSANIQYVGFESKPFAREYTFRVQESPIEQHEITFTILNEAFNSHALSYQDAPDLCSRKLQRERTATSEDNPMKSHYRISETELADYRDSHSPKGSKGLLSSTKKQNS
jgi:hypothetical protein